MAEMHPDSKEITLSRRGFLQGGAALGAALGLSTVAAGKGPLGAQVAEAAVVKEHDSFPYVIAANYKRFPQINTIFARRLREPEVGKYGKMFKNPQIRDQRGWTLLEKALMDSAWAVHDLITPGSAGGQPNTPGFAWEGPVNPQKYQFKDVAEATQVIKKAARYLGASLVGIAKYDPRWVYERLFSLTENKELPAEFPFEPKYVVVMAIEMDYQAFNTAPSWIATAGSALIYSRMSELGYSLASFIRKIGYHAFAAGNDVALSVPYAIAAGLGELGRNGLLITYEYGPRVRLCKVFTEMELIPDKPKTFGVMNFCKTCKRCAESCPSKAIPMDDEPTMEGPTISNNPGVLKWYINPEKCHQFWGENGGDCGSCIASCPYNKPDMWHHRLSTAMATALSGTPAAPLMPKLDIFFGYGKVSDQKAIDGWWDAEQKQHL